MPAPTTVTIRMYNPGFGDCFLVTVKEHDKTWRMLVDCGVHSHGRFKVNGQSRGIGEIVGAVIDQLSAEAADGQPAVDVVVATHRHADHISGFAEDAWNAVRVGEVWVPFVEDPEDPDTRALKGDLGEAAKHLQALVARARKARPGSRSLALALDFAANSSGNALATKRLVEGEFANRGTVRVRYLPSREPAENAIPTGIDGVTVHVLGPSRKAELLKRMNPPASVRWLEDADHEALPATDREDLFDTMYRVPRDEVETRIPEELVKTRNSLRLNEMAYDEDSLLAAASVLERSVNNTSVFFVLDVHGSRFVFVGDSQQGAWDHVLDDPAARRLVTDATFYKVGHHGSHNATPRRYVEEILGDDATAMVPVGFVRAWADTIPNAHLLEGLAEKHIRIIRADSPHIDKDVTVDDAHQLWTEARFTCPVG
ncbi:MBL fold metallo-hydrolase [Microbacterium sp. BWT-B31]|uniref:MBL fold metallo-hydrolase n=1 Tax=Microbacterium sp. BWT-B31 TaxID=3232072 RepID=UPI003528C4EC